MVGLDLLRGEGIGPQQVLQETDAGLAPRLTSAQGAAFLRRMVAQFPFPVQSLQSDGGSEFLKEFGPMVAGLQLTHYFNRPNYPQGKG